MSEISARYDRGSLEENGTRKFPSPDDILQACYGVIDAHKEALSRGKLTQAKKCQEILKKYKEQITSPEILGEILNYQRTKFGELVQLREQTELGQSRKEVESQIEEKNEAYRAKIMSMHKLKRRHIQGRKETQGIVAELLKELEKPKLTIQLEEKSLT